MIADKKGSVLLRQINRFSFYFKYSRVVFGIFFWTVLTLIICLSLFVLDNLFDFPAGLRLPLILIGVFLMLVVFIRKIGMPAVNRRNQDKTALAMEKKLRIPDNLLINAYQLEKDTLKASEMVFAKKVITETEGWVAGKDCFDRGDLRKYLKWLVVLIPLFIIWGLYIVFFPGHVQNALVRYVKPLEDIPPVSNISLRVKPSTDITLLEGDDLLVSLKIDSSETHEGSYSPVIVYLEGSDFLKSLRTTGENSKLVPVLGKKNFYTYLFRDVVNPFAFRIFSGNTYTKSIYVAVRPLPKIKKSSFIVAMPSYTGVKPEKFPGPPATLSCLKGTNLTVKINLDSPVNELNWAQRTSTGFNASSDRKSWSIKSMPAVSGKYTVSMREDMTRRNIVVTQSEISLIDDKPPVINFVTDDRNRYVNPGAKLDFNLQATDDFGIREIVVTANNSEDNTKQLTVKLWKYLGPPGNPGPLKETFSLKLDPQLFVPGNNYLLQAVAKDFSPSGQSGVSNPIVLRVKSINDIYIAGDTVMNRGLSYLKKAIEAQHKANGMTENVKLHLETIVKKKEIKKHQKVMVPQQRRVKNYCARAMSIFKKDETGKSYVGRLEPLVNGEIAWVMDDLNKLNSQTASGQIPKIDDRQKYILKQLIALLGEIAERKQRPDRNQPEKTSDESAVAEDDENPSPEEFGRDLKDHLQDYVKSQKRMVKMSKALLDDGLEDLTGEEEKVLGELAREQSEWAKLFEEKLTDFSKLPLQDFGDGSVAEEYNEVYQEIKKAEKELYEKKIELAVPHEQSGLEKAEELVHNLERWLPDTPDYQKWLMEEPLEPSDIPLAELPMELEDIVGELLDSEEEMTDEVEDVTSSWMDSLDKGAGWDAMDGPISNMSARGVTGNRLPNNQEIGGRSGEGRTGKSHGQMVEAAAEGKDGRKTPTRLTPSPFEQGSIEDKSKSPTGGASGGGKLSGFTGEGLRGPSPPPQSLKKMARLSGRQSMIRQQAEALSLKLRAYNLPTGDLESSIRNMKEFEMAAKKGDGLRLRRAYSRIVDHLRQSRKAVEGNGSIHREQSKLPDRYRKQIMKGLKDGVPKGYEKMIREYFKVLAEESQ